MNKQRIIDKSIIAACIVAIVWGVLWLAVYKPKVWEIVWLFLVMAVFFYFLTLLAYDILKDRLPWRKNCGEHREIDQLMMGKQSGVTKKRRIIDKSIIAVCNVVVVWGGLWAAFNKPKVLVLLALAVLLYFITGWVYEGLKDWLPWRRKKNHEHHE